MPPSAVVVVAGGAAGPGAVAGARRAGSGRAAGARAEAGAVGAGAGAGAAVDLKQELVRMQSAQFAAAAAARQSCEVPQVPHQAAAALLAAEAHRAKHEDPYDRDSRLRKDKLDNDAVQTIARRRAEAQRDQSFIRQQMAAKSAATATERRRRSEVDPKLAFIAQQQQHVPRNPAAERAAAAQYKEALDKQNYKKMAHMWDEYVLDRLHFQKEEEANLLAMGRKHLAQRRRRVVEANSLRSTWAQAVDDKREGRTGAL